VRAYFCARKPLRLVRRDEPREARRERLARHTELLFRHVCGSGNRCASGRAVRSQVGCACPTASPADGVHNRAARKSDESTKDRRRYPKFEDCKPRCGRVDPEAHYEPGDASHQACRSRTYRRPSQSQRPCAEWQARHRLDGTSTPHWPGPPHRARTADQWPLRGRAVCLNTALACVEVSGVVSELGEPLHNERPVGLDTGERRFVRVRRGEYFVCRRAGA
jgi:hypothetical protein